MGGCSSTNYKLATGTPRTIEDWARIGLRETLKVHKWLSQQLVIQETARKKQQQQQQNKNKTDNTNETDTSNTITSTSSNIQDNTIQIRVRFTVNNHTGSGDLEIYETPATLAAVREDIRALAREIGGTHRLGDGNILREDRFLRIAGWLVVNRSFVTTCPIPLYMKLAPNQCHTLLPELTIHKIRQLLQRSRILMTKSELHNAVVITEFAVDRWLSKEKASIGDSVFFPFFWRVVDSSVILPTEITPASRLRYTPAEFVQAVDRFCTFTEEELLRFAFFCLARVGTDPGETPFIAVSSLTKEFIELHEASKDRTHPSRSFLDETKKRITILSKSMDERVRVLKTAACVTLSEKYDREQLELNQSSTNVNNNVSHQSSNNKYRSKAPTFFSIVKGPEDLMTVAEFLDMAKRSPISVFDIVYLQLHMRRRTFGEEFWLNRQRDINLLRSRSKASIAMTKSHHKSKELEDTGDDFGSLYYYGYDAQRAKPLQDPYTLTTLPTLAKVEALSVPLAVRFALASGTINTPSLKDEPYLPHHHLQSDRKSLSTNDNGQQVPLTREREVPHPSAPPLVAEEDDLTAASPNEKSSDRGSGNKRSLSTGSTTKRSIPDNGAPPSPDDTTKHSMNHRPIKTKSSVSGTSGTSDYRNDNDNNDQNNDIHKHNGSSGDYASQSISSSVPMLTATTSVSNKSNDIILHHQDTLRSTGPSPVPGSNSRRSSVASQGSINEYRSQSQSSTAHPSSATKQLTSSSSTNGNNERKIYQGRKKNRKNNKGKVDIEDSDPFNVDEEAAASHWKNSRRNIEYDG